MNMCHNWKKQAAKAFFRFLRNDNKTPLRSFADPSNGGKLTTRRFEEPFRDAWQPVFNRLVNVLPTGWDNFESKYKDYLTSLVGIRDDNFDAHELAAQAARFNRGAVGGLDGWTQQNRRASQ
jgi:hypothetical protein